MGRSDSRAGKNVTERMKEATMPMATKLPRCRYGRHFGKVHAQESERSREAREKNRIQVEADGFDDGISPGFSGTQTLLQGHQQVHAVRHDDHQHDGRCGRDRWRKRQPDPYPQPHRHQYGKDDDDPGRQHPGPAPSEDAKDHGHEKKARGQEDHLAVDRGFHECLVDHGRADDAKVHTGESLFGFRSGRPGKFGDCGHGLQQALLRQLDGYVHDADIAVQGQNAPGDTRVGQSNAADTRPRFRLVQFQRIDKIPHVQVVPVGGRVLKVGERVDALGIRCLPGGFREPDSGRECSLGRGVTIVGNNQERDVLALPVGILQLFQCQELRIVLVKENPVVGGEFKLSHSD